MRTVTLGKQLLAAVLGMGLVLWLAVVSGWAGAQEALDAFTRQDYATAFRELQPLAQHGDAAAQSLLGFLYAHGYGVAQDYAQAAQWFRRAADQGHPRAQFYLGGLYSAGHGVPQDAAQAAQWYRRAADQGEPRAQLGLGLLYAKGQGVPQDAAQAAQWIRRAAEQGLAPAQFSLGVLYAEGQGVPQDAHQAAQWYRRAADQGDAAAQYNLGQLYGLGRGVPQDLLQAHLWLTLAATGLPVGPQRTTAVHARDAVAARLTPPQLTRAQALAREWQPKSETPGERTPVPAPAPLPAPPAVPVSPPRQALIRQIQERLQAAGFTPGAMDGALGPQTRNALRLFQNAKGLPPTGELDEKTLAALGVR
jgi:hypothetical protein